ncbi:alpha/beta hydrolase [Halomonas sp.]|uniref:RBBP9/YdeN family alpha/beta hydrolase n=1 Tax=Halomonas sp. TaxID=1486246 RepID=UPI00298D6352|nr:alpha/beta hydrolase [Halomonas sp.]MDW7747145.1 alpha/beta hydrolase [Halomonas sp.]
MADHLPSFEGYHCLIVPGWQGSGDDHWQTHWQSRLPHTSRTRVGSWQEPELDDWIGALNRATRRIDSPILLVAHSLGCITVAHWAARQASSSKVAGALLVAPADVERGSVSRPLASFAPIPMHRLPFPSLVVGSTNDPAASARRAANFATAWDSELVVLDDAGHLNPASGHREWEEGFALLQRLVLPGALAHSA